MPKKCMLIEMKDQDPEQDIFMANSLNSKFIPIYRVSLVKDGSIKFGKSRLGTSLQARSVIRKLISERGQPDREQICVILLNAKNEIIGLNIIAMGSLSSAVVSPREVLKPAIIANSSAIILCHNHPSGDPEPSWEDHCFTKKIIQAAKVVDIQVHEHLIINMEDGRYYSFADNRDIERAYDKISREAFSIDLEPLKNIRASYDHLNGVNDPSIIGTIDDKIDELYAYFKKITDPYFSLVGDFRKLKDDILHQQKIASATLKAI